MAEFIQKTDTLNEGREKLNAAIADAETAKGKSDQALNKANSALTKAGSTQTQLDTLIIESGTSDAETIQARGNFELLYQRLDNVDTVLTDKADANFDELFRLEKSNETYLFDLQLAGTRVNQGLVISERTDEIFATQAVNIGSDLVESFILSRMTQGGKLKDSMTVRYGGHGTSFGVEVDGDITYIWSIMIKPDAAGSIGTQYICRFPYTPNTEINIDSIGVEKFTEYPNRFYYASCLVDQKNDYIGFRISDFTGDENIHMFEVYNLSDYKQGVSNKIFDTYTFDMDADYTTLQGLAMDGKDFYVSFGMTANDFRLFRVDLVKGVVIESLQRPFGKNENGGYEGGFSEPEGLYLYTDPVTRNKILLTVIVTDLPGRRKQKLFAVTEGYGIQKFTSFSAQRTQNVKLTRDNGETKRLPEGTTLLSNIREAGEYYFTTAESNLLQDHPMPNVAGWYMKVGASDPAGGFIQRITRSSTVLSQEFWRIVRTDGSPSSEWRVIESSNFMNPVTPTLENGWRNYYPTEHLKYYGLYGQLCITGLIYRDEGVTTSHIFRLPSGLRPTMRQAFVIRTSTGSAEFLVNTNGYVSIPIIITGEVPAYYFINATIPLF